MNRLHISAIALALASSAFASDPFASTLTSIIDNNPDMRSRQLLIDAQACDDADANALANPSVEFGYLWGLEGAGDKWNVGISQDFEWPGVYRLRSRAAKQGITAAQLQAMGENLDMALGAKQLMLQIVFLRKQMQMSQKAVDALTTMGEAIDSSLAKGGATVLDQRKQQFELYKAKTAHADLQAKMHIAAQELQALAAGAQLPIAELTDYPVEQMLTPEQYAAQFAQLDPVLASAAMEAEQAATLASAAKQSRLPGFTLGYSFENEEGSKFTGLSVGMTLPFFQNRKAATAARLRREAADLTAQQRTAQATAEIESTIEQMKLWRSHMEVYSATIKPEEYMELLNISAASGQISAIEYLTELQYVYDTISQYNEVQYNYHMAAASLNRYSLLDLLQK